MLGAIAGDIIGSIYERDPIKRKDFPLFSPGSTFTDDTICTVAVADCLLSGSRDFAHHLRTVVRRYPTRSYGAGFLNWALSDDLPYGSRGNGAAMRVSPVAYLARDDQQALGWAAASAIVTHNHPEAVKGAQSVTMVMRMAMKGADVKAIRRTIEEVFGYNLGVSLNRLRPRYRFDTRAAKTVPIAILCALEATDYEDAVRNAVSMGGDADTMAAIAGGIAEVMFGLPEEIAVESLKRLPSDLAEVVQQFYSAVNRSESAALIS